MIVYYISSHGFGHSVRSCEVIRQLPPDAALTLRTGAPEWFLRRELAGREFELAPAVFDCGTLGADSAQVDLAMTLDRLEPLLDANDARVAAEAEWLRRAGARVVVSDVPPLALRAARLAGVPSILIANFTWPAIYQYILDRFPVGDGLHARTVRAIERMQHDYDAGDLLLATEMSIGMRACRRRIDTPLVARRGVNQRECLVEGMGLDPDRPIYLLYLGLEGLAGMRWDRAGELGGAQLMSYAPPPGAEGVVRALPEDLIEHADAAASVDAVVAKAGYGICGECITAGTPLLYLPRPQFAEMIAVDDLMARWGGGLCIAEKDFKALRWGPHLDALGQRAIRTGAIDCDGAAVCAEWIMRAWRERMI